MFLSLRHSSTQNSLEVIIRIIEEIVGIMCKSTLHSFLQVILEAQIINNSNQNETIFGLVYPFSQCVENNLSLGPGKCLNLLNYENRGYIVLLKVLIELLIWVLLHFPIALLRSQS